VPLGHAPRRPAVALVPGRLVRSEGLQHLRQEARPPLQRRLPARKVVGVDDGRPAERGRKAGGERALPAVSSPNGLKRSKLGSVRGFGIRKARSRVTPPIGSGFHSVLTSKYRVAVATEG